MQGLALTKAVVKTTKILECLSREPSLGITELVNRLPANFPELRMNKSTAYRFRSSLKELGFVRRDPETERCSMTLKTEAAVEISQRLGYFRKVLAEEAAFRESKSQ